MLNPLSEAELTCCAKRWRNKQAILHIALMTEKPFKKQWNSKMEVWTKNGIRNIK